ncbi:MAG TPA: enoyl-CoA hydratase-related protein [Myxococcota bacterium]|nr:enoyl-CoA hydratase-related protein [Myxococcota bacterium]
MALVEVAVEDGIARVTLNRPEALNSLSIALLAELDAAATRIERESGIRGAIVTGAGRAFAAGADIEEIARLDRDAGSAFARRGQAVFSRLENLEKPVVAAVNGFALGGGCELALACHVRIASTKAKFGQPEVKLGILPGFGGTQRLPRLVGRGKATELVLHGGHVSAEEALRIGLVNEVVEPDALLPRAAKWLAECFANGPRALGASLRAIRDGLDRPLAAALDLEAQIFGELCGTPEMKEGTAAFLGKRAPKF